jgi:endonuclease/exonuclease/phosphatase family metal-dependent hydrolase
VIRLATYNVEWFDALFDNRGALLDDDRWSGRHDVTRHSQIDALARVFREIDADAVMIVEAPDTSSKRSTLRALDTFAKHAGLRTTQAIIGFTSDTQQEIALLYDPKVLTVAHDPKGQTTQEAPQFDGQFQIDLDVDTKPDPIRFSKPPLELSVTTKGGIDLRLIGVHIKSKAPHGARSKAAVMRVSIENRRKQLAQCIWLRRRALLHLTAGENLIVMGDFNDGPGLDEYEKLFGQSGVEIVLGTDADPNSQLFDPHASEILSRKTGPLPSSSRFYIPHKKRYLNAMLDYIMVSPPLRSVAADGCIWHPFDHAGCYQDNALQQALLTASDHFPVTLDLDID